VNELGHHRDTQEFFACVEETRGMAFSQSPPTPLYSSYSFVSLNETFDEASKGAEGTAEDEERADASSVAATLLNASPKVETEAPPKKETATEAVAVALGDSPVGASYLINSLNKMEKQRTSLQISLRESLQVSQMTSAHTERGDSEEDSEEEITKSEEESGCEEEAAEEAVDTTSAVNDNSEVKQKEIQETCYNTQPHTKHTRRCWDSSQKGNLDYVDAPAVKKGISTSKQVKSNRRNEERVNSDEEKEKSRPYLKAMRLEIRKSDNLISFNLTDDDSQVAENPAEDVLECTDASLTVVTALSNTPSKAKTDVREEDNLDNQEKVAAEGVEEPTEEAVVTWEGGGSPCTTGAGEGPDGQAETPPDTQETEHIVQTSMTRPDDATQALLDVLECTDAPLTVVAALNTPSKVGNDVRKEVNEVFVENVTDKKHKNNDWNSIQDNLDNQEKRATDIQTAKASGQKKKDTDIQTAKISGQEKIAISNGDSNNHKTDDQETPTLISLSSMATFGINTQDIIQDTAQETEASSPSDNEATQQPPPIENTQDLFSVIESTKNIHFEAGKVEKEDEESEEEEEEESESEEEDNDASITEEQKMLIMEIRQKKCHNYHNCGKEWRHGLTMPLQCAHEECEAVSHRAPECTGVTSSRTNWECPLHRSPDRICYHCDKKIPQDQDSWTCVDPFCQNTTHMWTKCSDVRSKYKNKSIRIVNQEDSIKKKFRCRSCRGDLDKEIYNIGPVTCATCNETIGKSIQSIQCHLCEARCHESQKKSCTGIPKHFWSRALQGKVDEKLRKPVYVCPNCMNQFGELSPEVQEVYKAQRSRKHVAETTVKKCKYLECPKFAQVEANFLCKEHIEFAKRKGCSKEGCNKAFGGAPIVCIQCNSVVHLRCGIQTRKDLTKANRSNTTSNYLCTRCKTSVPATQENTPEAATPHVLTNSYQSNSTLESTKDDAMNVAQQNDVQPSQQSQIDDNETPEDS
jgi:hypothetical protein